MSKEKITEEEIKEYFEKHTIDGAEFCALASLWCLLNDEMAVEGLKADIYRERYTKKGVKK